MAQFDPGAHPPLADLGARLRELAGDAAYKAGRDYLRKGHVHDAAVAGTLAYATVTGSTDYSVTVAFPTVEATKVTCTCPAHRRRAYCKHVVAVCVALVEQPAAFAVRDALPETAAPKTAPRAPRRPARQKTDPAELRAAGLGVLDRLLTELTDGGLAQLGPEKAALIQQCAELVRALKLRRLGNLLMQLQRAVADPRAADEPAFARLLLDLSLCRAATAAQLEGRVALDPRLAEDLLGKTWRAGDLEPVTGLELVQLASDYQDDGEFAVETSYLIDLGTLEVYVEREITPSLLWRRGPKPQHRVRLMVEEAGLYPGLAPRRIRLGRFRRAPLRAEDVDRLVRAATADLTEIRRRLVERAALPFGRPEVAVLFRPSALLAAPESGSSKGARREATLPAGAVDAAGRFVALDWSRTLADQVPGALLEDGALVLFGLATPGEAGIVLRCLSTVDAAPRGRAAPIVPG